MKTPLRVYADTSVFGGCFKDKFRDASVRFFEQVREGAFVLVISDVTLRELAPAPPEVYALFENLPPANVERAASSERRFVSSRLI